jgi:hypothetical protein
MSHTEFMHPTGSYWPRFPPLSVRNARPAATTSASDAAMDRVTGIPGPILTTVLDELSVESRSTIWF